MKVAEWKRVARPLLPADEAWEFRGSMCYRLPTRRVVSGVLAEGSGFDKGVYIWRVTMPLFVPSQNVVLSWSDRIGGGARKYYRHDDDALAAAITAAVEGLGTEEDALGKMVSRGAGATRNRFAVETVAYAQLLLGDLASAHEALDRAGAGVAGTPVEQEIIVRARLIGRVLDEERPDRAISQLDRWCDQTAGALGLRRSSDPDQAT
jgi:hypothetical protein